MSDIVPNTSSFTFITYFDCMRSGQEFILRNGDSTKAVSIFLTDEQLVSCSQEQFRNIRKNTLDKLCQLWFDRYGVHVTYTEIEGQETGFHTDNVIEGEIVPERKAISGLVICRICGHKGDAHIYPNTCRSCPGNVCQDGLDGERYRRELGG